MSIEHIRDSDVFLVSYPRSGNTWLRTIIAEILYGTSGSKLSEIGNYVPDIHACQVDDLTLDDPRVIKSHFNYTPEYGRVIYIARDPRDVYISYFKYLKQRNQYHSSLYDFISDVCCGKIFPGSWSNHVNSWLLSRKHVPETDNTNFMLIKYENMRSDTKSYIKKLSEFLGKILNKTDLMKIYDKTTLKKMREKEKRGLFYWLPEDLNFINEGKSGKWKDQLSEDLVQHIHQFNRNEMDLLNYH